MSSIILLTINVNVILLTAANVGWTMLIMLRYYIQRKEKFTFILDVVNAIGVLAYIAAKFFFIPEMHTFSNAFILGIATSFTLLVIIYYIKYVIAERKAKNKNPNRTNSGIQLHGSKYGVQDEDGNCNCCLFTSFRFSWL